MTSTPEKNHIVRLRSLTPASSVGGQAGLATSSSCDGSVMEVDHLASNAYNTKGEVSKISEDLTTFTAIDQAVDDENITGRETFQVLVKPGELD